MRKTAFHIPKHGLLHAERRPFAWPDATSCQSGTCVKTARCGRAVLQGHVSYKQKTYVTMKLNKYILSLLAAAGCAVGVAAITDGRTGDKQEKVKPETALPTKVDTQRSAYPRFSLEGSEDGVPYGLRLTGVNDKEVSLAWLTPEKTDGYWEDFEGHDDFVINSPGSIGWQYIDADNAFTYTWQACTFPNMGQKMAFIVMNPSQTSPATDSNPNYKPYSGDKMLVDFCAADVPNNDYIISPVLNFASDFKVSFMARSYSSTYALERVRVGYSTTGISPSNFIWVNDGDYIELPAEWNLYEFDIPREARYVTINCVSDDAFMLLIDDIFIGTNEVRPGVKPMRVPAAGARLTGFNVYRNGTKVNSAPVTQVRYTDTVDDYGTYDYTVTAVYSDNTESEQSEPLTVEVPDIRLLPFEDDFETWTLAADKWSTVNHDSYTDSNWGIDYYAKGLVDPCATFRYSSLRNYNQSLMTRELNTANVKGTYLRFNLKLQHERKVNTDYLTVEVTSDGGKTWKEVAQFDNTQGEFDWKVCQYNIGQYLDGNLFRVRFRAHGVEATYIDYWFVDDVKVWTPDWATATLTVMSADGPVAGCPVTLTGNAGGIYNVTTDDRGQAVIGEIEDDTYNVSIVNDRYNVYNGTWTVSKDGTNEFTAQLTRPVITLSETDVTADMAAESNVVRTVTLGNEGDGPMVWYLNTKPEAGKGDASNLWDIQSTFNASGDLQSCIAFDGENYYTSSFTELGEFWKYDKDGKLLERFRLPDMYFPVYDLTFDGRYFYGGDGSNRVFKFDFYNRRVADIITVAEEPGLEITHCCYDPDMGGLWIGGWNTLGLIGMDGKVLSRIMPFDASTTLAVIGSAYDNVSPGGPYLWLADGQSSENMIDYVTIYQYNINSGKLTGVKHTVTDVPGYKIGDASIGVNSLGGLSTSFDIKDGTLTLTGVLQQSPSLVFNYTLCEVDQWVSMSPKHGTVLPGENQDITFSFNSVDTKNGDKLATEAEILTLPELGRQLLNVNMNVNADAAAPRPVEVKAEPGTATVKLSWKPGDDSRAPSSYNVYRDGRKVNEEAVAGTEFTDDKLVYGEYSYKVTAVYDGGVESLPSDSVAAFVKQGAQYYAPIEPAATVTDNKNVSLAWKSPLAHAGEAATASWSTGVHVDQLGMTEGGYFYAASVWEPEDLVPYRNKQISSVSVQLVNPCSYLALHIIKDGETIYRKTYSDNIVYDGTYTDITVDEPLSIEPGATYYFAIQIMNASGIMPLAMDDSPAVNGKGNALSMDGETWFPASYQGISGNFNINVNFGAAEATAEQEPSGYNVYRDGDKLNAEPVTSTGYMDAVDEGGRHEYAITSVYADGGESAQSEPVNIDIISIDGRYAPSAIDANVQINRDVTLRWDYPTSEVPAFRADITTRPVTVDKNMPEYFNSFVGHDEGVEMGVASDNNFIYTSTYSKDGRVNKYTMAGEFIESFDIEGVEGIRNIVYDGENFYVGDYSTSIYKVDMNTHTVLETLSISEFSRHLAYIPELDGGNGGFEVGDWETSIYVRKDGSKIGTGPTLLGASGTAYHDGLLYAFEQGGDNTRTIGIYDFATSNRVGSIDVTAYSELTDISTATAGGMSVISRPDGSKLLAMALQRSDANTRFVFVELESVSGVAGYNVYRNGEKLNEEPLERRYFEESIDTEGTYQYGVETVYIDGSVSEQRAVADVQIQSKGTAKVPADVKAVQSTYGYNVLLSFVDPDMNEGAVTAESFEAAEGQAPVSVVGWTNSGNAWTVTADYAYDGAKSMIADEGSEATMIIPTDGISYLKMAVRNADDHNGHGSVSLLRSIGGIHDADFIQMGTFQTNEAWTEIEAEIPAGTAYIAIRKAAGVAGQLVDAVRLYAEKTETDVYAYDIYRNGEQINGEPVQGISYIDRNLLPGHYDYQVRLITKSAAVSELSETVSIDLDYDNGGLAPTGLTAGYDADGNVRLDWQFPALGEPIYLRWHDGNSYDAGGLSSGGAFFAGARWYASDLKDYERLALTDVEFYINQIPDALFVLVYEGNTLVRQQYVPTMRQYSFNNVKLDEPLDIDTSKDLLVAVYIEHNEITAPLGYDKGPANNGRGNLYSNDGKSWSLLSDSETGIDANWNISIGLSPYSNTPLEPAKANSASRKTFAPKVQTGEVKLVSVPVGADATSQKNAFLGYNVYRNRERLNGDMVKETSYIDDTPADNKYLEYQVSAVYSASGEKYSAPVTLTATGVDGVESYSGLRVVVEGGDIHVYGIASGALVTLYDTNGVLIYKGTARSTGDCVIPGTGIPTGNYIVKADGAAVKFAKSDK